MIIFNLKRTLKVILEVSDSAETKRLLDILESLNEDPGGKKKQEIMEKLEMAIADVKSTIS